ncbi:MAG: DoxX family protein [bacterium]
MIFYDTSWPTGTGRLLIVLSFVVAGLLNLTPAAINMHIERLGGFHVPFPRLAFWIGIALQFTGCALILLGWHADIGVVCLIVFTVAATAIYHRFWSKTDPMQCTISRITLIGNTAIVGGLLLLLQNVR